jgi:tetratricopeptide (TPR) repeat protein
LLLRGVYEKKEDYHQAVNDYNKAIELKPKYTEAYNNRGSVYGKLGNSSIAIQNFKIAAQLGHKEAQQYLSSHGTQWL